jgi:HD-GYP domain-containing protein (c-di-GMP phosphodiesterase class II)
VNSEKNYLNLLNIILIKMMEISGADAGTLYILEDDRLHFRILRNISLNIFQSAYDKIDLPPITLDRDNIDNMCAYAAVKNKPVSVDDVYESEEFNFSGPKNYDKITGYRTRSMLSLPLTKTENGIDTVIGVIQLINAIDRRTGEVRPFEDIDDPPLLPSLAGISANALASLMHTKEIKELFNSFVKVMTKAIDERSPYNVNHTNNIAIYGERFTDYLNSRFAAPHEFHFSENRQEQLVMAGLLHDIGKIITPLEIMDKPDRLGSQLETIKYRFEIKRCQTENNYLKGGISRQEYENKLEELAGALALIESVNTAGFLPGAKLEEIRTLAGITYLNEAGEETPVLSDFNMESLTIVKGTLTEGERNIMQEHASVTSRLLSQMSFNEYYKDVKKWAESHHEFLDGSGYPHGLSGSDVTTEMCILSIVDIYDALTARDRPYKKAVPVEKALDILGEMVKEGKLHPELVSLFNESKIWQTD